MFTPALFQFLRDLKDNNRRDWFQDHKQRYETDVRQPLLAFIEAFSKPLEEVSPHFLADKGSLFRIHRDTRFSADKTPYKTHAAAQFRHDRGKDAHAPCFYLHLEPGDVCGGGGLWMPDPASLTRVREAMVAWPQRWQEARAVGLAGGESLKRPPKGFDPQHPFVEDLKRKSLVTMVSFSEEEACQAGFLDSFTRVCQRIAPLTRFICQALDLPF